MAKKDKKNKGKADKAAAPAETAVVDAPDTTAESQQVAITDLSSDDADKVVQWAEKKGFTAVVSKPKTGSAGRPYANPHVTADGRELPTPNARNVSKAAKAYEASFGTDAKKTVLNYLGATSITGANGIDDEKLPQALEIFSSDEEFIPAADGTKKKKDKKGKKAKAEEQPELEIEEPKAKDKKGKKKDKKGKGKKAEAEAWPDAA